MVQARCSEGPPMLSGQDSACPPELQVTSSPVSEHGSGEEDNGNISLPLCPRVEDPECSPWLPCPPLHYFPSMATHWQPSQDYACSQHSSPV